MPILDAPPILTGPVVVNASSVFQCEAVQYLDDPEQVFEVFWTFNGVSDPAIPPQLLLNQERIATLNISFLKSHVDKYVSVFHPLKHIFCYTSCCLYLLRRV